VAHPHDYSSIQLLRYVEVLGKGFLALGLNTEADSLRVYHWALRQQHVGYAGELRVHWHPDLVLEWMKVLRLPPFANFYRALPMGTPECPGCHRNRMNVKVELSCGLVRKLRCRACTEVWVEEQPRSYSQGGPSDVH